MMVRGPCRGLGMHKGAYARVTYKQGQAPTRGIPGSSLGTHTQKALSAQDLDELQGSTILLQLGV